jgi:carboxymethylenebutenolidase
METRNITVPLRDGEMGAYLALPEGKPAGAIIAIMEIWGVNETMRSHAQEFAEAGFICLVPDIFWRQAPGIELDDTNLKDAETAVDLYYFYDYDLGVQDMEDTMTYLRTTEGGNGKVGTVGYCLGGKMGFQLCCRTDIDCAVAYYGTYIEHAIAEAPNLHRPFMLHQAMADAWVPPAVCRFIQRQLAPNPLVEIHEYHGADHAFARHGSPVFDAQHAERALGLSIDFLRKHLS